MPQTVLLSLAHQWVKTTPHPYPFLDGHLPPCGKLLNRRRLFHQLSDQEAKMPGGLD